MLKPRPYQITGRDFLAARSRALLADEMRVGKTPQAILAAEEKFGGGDVLVLCPAIAVPHWHREWDKWAPDSQITLDVMSFDRARNMWNAGTLQPRRYDVMIVDEAHFCKNPEAQRTKMVYGKGGLGYQVGAIWALSGTPATKHAGELWPMLRAFGATNMDYDAFVDRYCSYWWHKTRRERIIKGTREDKVSELRELLKPIMLRRTRAEVAPDMPEIDFQFLEIAPQPFDLPDIMSKGMTDEMLLAAIGGRNDLFPNDRQQVALQKIGPLAEEIAFAIENDLLKQTVVFGWPTHVDAESALQHLGRVHHWADLRQAARGRAGLLPGGQDASRLRQHRRGWHGDRPVRGVACLLFGAGLGARQQRAGGFAVGIGDEEGEGHGRRRVVAGIGGRARAAGIDAARSGT